MGGINSLLEGARIGTPVQYFNHLDKLDSASKLLTDLEETYSDAQHSVWHYLLSASRPYDNVSTSRMITATYNKAKGLGVLAQARLHSLNACNQTALHFGLQGLCLSESAPSYLITFVRIFANVDLGSGLYIQNADMCTPLLQCLTQHKKTPPQIHLDYMQLLCPQIAIASVITTKGTNALQYAIEHSMTEVCKYLLALSVNQRKTEIWLHPDPRTGNTPLHDLVQKRQVEIIHEMCIIDFNRYTEWANTLSSLLTQTNHRGETVDELVAESQTRFKESGLDKETSEMKMIKYYLQIAKKLLSGTCVRVQQFLQQHNLKHQTAAYLNKDIDDAMLDQCPMLQRVLQRLNWLELLYKFLVQNVDDSVMQNADQISLQQLGLSVGEAAKIKMEWMALRIEMKAEEELNVQNETPLEALFGHEIVMSELEAMLMDPDAKFPRRILFWGAPGAGKSSIAAAFARKSGMKLLRMNISDVESKYVGETSQNIKRLLQKACQEKAIVLIDEIDSLAQSRESAPGGHEISSHHCSVTNTLLQELDHLDRQSFTPIIFATTNLLSRVDEALKSRFHQCIQCVLPNQEARAKIFHHYLHSTGDVFKCAANVNVEEYARMTPLWSGRNILFVVKDAQKRARVMFWKQKLCWKEVNRKYVPCDAEDPDKKYECAGLELPGYEYSVAKNVFVNHPAALVTSDLVLESIRTFYDQHPELCAPQAAEYLPPKQLRDAKKLQESLRQAQQPASTPTAAPVSNETELDFDTENVAYGFEFFSKLAQSPEYSNLIRAILVQAVNKHIVPRVERQQLSHTLTQYNIRACFRAPELKYVEIQVNKCIRINELLQLLVEATHSEVLQKHWSNQELVLVDADQSTILPQNGSVEQLLADDVDLVIAIVPKCSTTETSNVTVEDVTQEEIQQ